MTDYTFASATDLVRLIKTRQISSSELLEHYFKRIDAHNAPINAVIAQNRDEARKAAKAADAALARGEDLGPLHGVPMTVKESYDVAGYKTTWGVPGDEGQPRARRRVVDPAPETGRRGHLRQNERAAAARRLPELQRHLRHDEQSVGQGPHPRRLVRRIGGGARRRTVRTRNRLRHRRLDQKPRALLRRVRPQTDVEPAAAARPRDAGRAYARRYFGDRPARAFGARSRNRAARDGRPRRNSKPRLFAGAAAPR